MNTEIITSSEFMTIIHYTVYRVLHRAVLKVRKRGDEYIVKDGWGDIKMTSQVSNMQQVKSILGEEDSLYVCFVTFFASLCLEMYARFKMVKKLLRNNDPKVEHHASLQTCVLYQCMCS